MTDENAGLTPEQTEEARTAYERSIARGDSTTREQQDMADQPVIPTGLEGVSPEELEAAAPAVEDLPVEDDMPPLQDPVKKSIFSDVNRMAAEKHDPALRSSRDLYTPEDEQEYETDWFDQYSLAVGEEHLFTAYQRSEKYKSFAEDPEWNITEEEITGRIEEFPEWRHDAVIDALEDAVSTDHADYIIDEARREFAIDDQLSKDGPWANMGYRALAGVTDPVAALATVLIPGVGTARATGGMSRLWTSATRKGRAGRYAFAGAVENAGIEAYLYDTSVTRRQEDIAYAALGGLVLGGTFGAIPGGPRKGSVLATEEVRLHTQGLKAQEELDAAVSADLRGDAPEYIAVPDSIREPVERYNGWALRDLDRDVTRTQEALEPLPVEGVALTRATTVSPDGKEYRGVTVLVRQDDRDAGAVEAMELKKEPETVQIFNSHLDEGMRGQGMGVRMYTKLIDEAQADGYQKLQSDSSVSESAIRVWDSLIRKGYRIIDNRAEAEKFVDVQGVNRLKMPGKRPLFELDLKPEPVARVEVDTPALKSLEDIKARKAAIRAEGAKVAAPVRAKIMDMMDTVGRAIEEYDKAIADANLTPAARANAEMKVNNAKRHFIAQAREEGVNEAMAVLEKSFIGINPKLEDFRKVFTGKLKKAAEKAGKAFEADNVKYNAKLDKLDDELAGLTAEEARLQAEGVEGQAGGAAFAGLEGDLPFAERFDVNAIVEDTPNYAGLNFRIDISASGNKSPNIGHKYFSSYLFEEGTGVANKDGGIAHQSVEEIARETHRKAAAMYGRSFSKALKLFKKEQKANGVKYSWLEKMDGKPEHDLSEAISDFIESPSDTTPRSVREAAAGWTDGMRYIHEQATLYGVKGYEFAFDPHYLPRIASGEKFREVATGWKHKEAGLNIDSPVEAVIYKGLRDAQPKADDIVLRAIAKSYADNTLYRVAGGGAIDLNTPDLAQLRATLVDTLKISDEQAEAFTKGLQAARDADKQSGRLKQRLTMDMNAELKVIKPDGTEGYLRLSDLFERNAGKLLNSYSHEIGGIAAFARAFDDSPTPIKSLGDLEEMEKFINEQELLSGREVGSRGAAVDAEHRKVGINSILGRPIVDSQTGAVLTRRLLNYNFINDMGLVPITQAGETGNIFSFASMKTMWQHNGIKQLTQRIRGAEQEEHLGGVLEAMGGLGTDHDAGSTAYKGFDYDANGKLRENGTIDSMLYSGARVTARAMQSTMKWQSGMAQASFVQELVNDAFRGNKRMTALRMADLGLTEADRAIMEKNLLKYGQFQDGKVVEGQKFLNPNFDLWDDPKLVQKLVMAASRKSRSTIQEASMGALHRWQMTSNIVKIGFQFQSFVVAAWSKQLMKAVTRHDMEALRGLVGASATVLLANYARIQATSAFRENREDYLEKQMEDYEFFKTTLFRMPQLSIAGRLIDTASLWATGETVAEPYRTSSLSSALDWDANPTGRRWGGFAAALGDMAQMVVTGEGEFSKKELRALRNMAPWQSLPPVSFLLNAAEAQVDIPKSNGLSSQKY